MDGVTWAQADWTHLKSTEKQVAKFARLPGKPQNELEPTKRTVINLTGKPLDDTATAILEKGLNFAPTPASVPFTEIISSVEQAVRGLPEDKAEEIRRESCRILSRATPARSNISRAERAALWALREDTEIVVLPADKGNATVILERRDYEQKMLQLLDDPAYRKIKTDPTKKIQESTAILLKNGALEENDIKRLRQRSAVAPRMYGLPKTHKDGMRPIVSKIGAPTYPLAQHLAGLLRPYVGKCAHHIRNSTDFISRLKELTLQDSDIMVSFDVVSLFTRVPLEDYQLNQ